MSTEHRSHTLMAVATNYMTYTMSLSKASPRSQALHGLLSLSSGDIKRSREHMLTAPAPVG